MLFFRKDTIHKFAAVICEKHVTGVAAKNVVIKFFRTNVIVNTTFILINTVLISLNSWITECHGKS